MALGLAVCAIALLGATAFGFGWRARNGRMRPVGKAAAPMPASTVPASTVPAGPAQPAQASQDQAGADQASSGASPAAPATAAQAAIGTAGPAAIGTAAQAAIGTAAQAAMGTAAQAAMGTAGPAAMGTAGPAAIGTTGPGPVALVPERPASGQPAFSESDLGAALGTRATLVQFSTAFCAPCRATRRILAEVAGMVDGVSHVEIDAESRLDLVRRLDIRRTPTTFVLDPAGLVTHRASGQPRKADVIAALGPVL